MVFLVCYGKDRSFFVYFNPPCFELFLTTSFFSAVNVIWFEMILSSRLPILLSSFGDIIIDVKTLESKLAYIGCNSLLTLSIRPLAGRIQNVQEAFFFYLFITQPQLSRQLFLIFVHFFYFTVFVQCRNSLLAWISAGHLFKKEKQKIKTRNPRIDTSC